jgi:hypothetical protein
MPHALNVKQPHFISQNTRLEHTTFRQLSLKPTLSYLH